MNISTNYFMNSRTGNPVSSRTKTRHSFAFSLDNIVNKNEKTSFSSPIVSKEGILTEEQLEYFKDTYDINDSTDYETKKSMLEDLKTFGVINEEDYEFMLSCVEQAHIERGSLSYAPILPILDKYGNAVTKDTLPEHKISSFIRKVEDWEIYNPDNWSEELTYLSNLFSKRYRNFPEYEPYAEKFSKIADILNVIFD